MRAALLRSYGAGLSIEDVHDPAPGRSATSHWTWCDRLAEHHPGIDRADAKGVPARPGRRAVRVPAPVRRPDPRLRRH